MLKIPAPTQFKVWDFFMPPGKMYYKCVRRAPLTKFCSNTTFFWRQSKLASLFS